MNHPLLLPEYARSTPFIQMPRYYVPAPGPCRIPPLSGTDTQTVLPLTQGAIFAYVSGENGILSLASKKILIVQPYLLTDERRGDEKPECFSTHQREKNCAKHYSQYLHTAA